jgi:predicted nucleotidyltransferase
MILSTIVGSRLHGTADENSDYDYRGVFIAPLEDIISPFRDVKDMHWVEGEEKADKDDTAYELRKFCRMGVQGNPTVLEILVGEEYRL